MKRVFPLIVALLFIAVLVASCLTGCNRITAGEVYDKYYIPAHSESYTTYERVRSPTRPMSAFMTTVNTAVFLCSNFAMCRQSIAF